MTAPGPADDIGRRGAYGCGPERAPRPSTTHVMHYPKRISKVKRARKLGFRARMRTRNGRKTINAKRRVGRKVQVV